MQMSTRSLVVAMIATWCLATSCATRVEAAPLTCAAFYLESDAQTILQAFPADPFNLDPDGDGVACDIPGQTATTAGVIAGWTGSTPVAGDNPSKMWGERVTSVESNDPTGGTAGFYVLAAPPNSPRLVGAIYLAGIALPKLGHPATVLVAGEPDQCYSAETQARLQQLFPADRSIRVEHNGNPILSETEFVWETNDAGQSVLVNELLVREGYAIVARLPGPMKYADRLLKAQQAARAEGAGLWGACA